MLTQLNQLQDQLPFIEQKINYHFRDSALLQLAFSHRSFINENTTLATQEHNERLEFLGDAVLELLVTQYLYQKYPNHPEGKLSQLRSHLVEAQTCSLYMDQLDVGENLLLGKGEQQNFERGKRSLWAHLFEALMGALYLDGGLIECHQFFFLHFTPIIEGILEHPQRNWKAELQEYTQQQSQTIPIYEVTDEQGPSHEKKFFISVFVSFKEVGKGEGFSKKQAQQNAAQRALESLKTEEGLL